MVVVTPEKFRKVMGNFATGVSVVTASTSDGRTYGVTVNSFTSVSLKPLLILICLENTLSGLRLFKEAKKFKVEILSEDQRDIAAFFSQKGDRSNNRPAFKGGLASLECEIVHDYVGGDHTIFVAEVKSAEPAHGEKQPLLFFRGRYNRLQSARGDQNVT